MLSAKVESFYLDTGAYPESLEALLAHDVASDELGPYARPRELIDPWGRRYYYRRGVGTAGFVLFTLGADGMLGGSGQDQDIANVRRADG
jgi:general secretion pathway protein G